MIGRLYTWHGAVWIVRARAGGFGRPWTAADGSTRRGGPAHSVLLERMAEGVWHERGKPSRRIFWPTGERVVRPFRGLRRHRP